MAALGPPSVCGRSPCQPDQTIVMPWASRKPLPAPVPRTTPVAVAGMTGLTALYRSFELPSCSAATAMPLVRLLTS